MLRDEHPATTTAKLPLECECTPEAMHIAENRKLKNDIVAQNSEYVFPAHQEKCIYSLFITVDRWLEFLGHACGSAVLL